MATASPAALRGMLRVDATRLVRDRFLLGTAAYLVGIAVVMRWALPAITDALAARWGFDLTPWHPLIVCHVTVVLSGVLTGMVGGFLLLEGREDRTVKAMLVAPVPLRTYLILMSAVLIALGAALAAAEAAIIGLALPPWPALAVAALAGATAGPANAFFQAAHADNKVAAIAYLKLVSAAALIALGAYFVPEPWQWLAGVYPPYWAAKAYWVAEAGGRSWPLWALGALPTSAFWGVIFARAFLRAARR